ncbi:hypothetical protein QL285_082603 [Trifolium repens]|nr:hypothetical protein QL285_082603 [Trifolium repens]
MVNPSLCKSRFEWKTIIARFLNALVPRELIVKRTAVCAIMGLNSNFAMNGSLVPEDYSILVSAANSQKFVKGEEVQPQKQSISPSFSLEDFSMLIDLTKQAKRRMCQSVIGMICKDRCVVGQSSIDVYKTYA